MAGTPLKQESDYKLCVDGRFVIRNYNQKKPFSNFLPGIAGLYGTPMWVFYVNRGQGVASFGTKNKDNAILEFFPANKAYQMVTSTGFRTFIKILKSDGRAMSGKSRAQDPFYEPFKEDIFHGYRILEQSMAVNSHELSIDETNKSLGLRTTVRYFTIPGEPLPVLARELLIENISSSSVEFELLDGHAVARRTYHRVILTGSPTDPDPVDVLMPSGGEIGKPLPWTCLV